MSPDGQRLALEVIDTSGRDIWVYDWQRDTMSILTSTRAAFGPLWTPDGRYIVFDVQGEGMYATRSDGSGKPQPLTRSTHFQFPSSFTPDGKRLSFSELAPDGRTFDLWTLRLESDSAGLHAEKPEIFMQTPTDERYPSFSPDGRWMAFSSNESGRFQVYVRAVSDEGGKWQISDAGGSYPMWSRNGHELFFETLDNRIMMTTYTVKGDSFVPGKPQAWSEKQTGGIVNLLKNVDLAPDGKRVVASMPAAEGERPQNHVTFLMNFFDEVRRKVPVGK